MTTVILPVGNVPKEFIENGVDGVLMDPIVGKEGGVYYDGNKESYTPFEETTSKHNLYAEAENEKSQLLRVMVEFEETSEGKKKKKGKVTQDVISKKIQTWADVETTMVEAVKDYERTHEGKILSSLQGLCHNVSNHGTTFSAWLELLPDGDYTSVLCGAFKLVIGAAKSAKNVRDLVFNSLGEIPTLLEHAKQYLGIHNLYKSKQLHYAFARLYAAIVVALKHILDWLKKKPWRHATTAFLQQGSYGVVLHEKMNIVWKLSTAVQEQARICSQWMIGSIKEDVCRQTVQLEGVTVTLEGVKDGVQGLGKMLGDIGSSATRIEDRLNALLTFFQADIHSTFEAAIKKTSSATRNRKGRELDAKDILELLAFDRGQAEQDIVRAVNEGQAFRSSDQERTKYFTEDARLRRWLTGRTSEVLLVNGNHEDKKISSLTFACGMFARSVASFPGAIPLSFFCGMHCDRRNEDVGAALMLSSLVCQLLVGYPDYTFSFLDKWKFDPKDICASNPDRIEALLSLFTELIQQVPESQIIFCLIDGIQYYEYQGRGADTCYAVREFLNLMGAEKMKAVFKLLITTPENSALVARVLVQGDVWTMPGRIESSDGGFDMRRQQLLQQAEIQEARVMQVGSGFEQGGWSEDEYDSSLDSHSTVERDER